MRSGSRTGRHRLIRQPCRRFAQGANGFLEIAIARETVLERQTEAQRGRARGREMLGRARLGEIDDPLVVAEIERQQLGMTVDAEPLDDQPVEMPDEEIREEEAGGL